MVFPLVYLAVAAALASALVSLGADRRPLLLRLAAFSLLGLSGLAALSAGLLALAEPLPFRVQLPLGLPWLPWHLRVDSLSGLFLALIGTVTVAVSLFGPGYTREFEHGRQPLAVLGLFTGLFVAGMELVLLADDAYAFMVAWELMSLSSYFLVAYQHQHSANRRAAFLYLLMAHIGALSILLGFGVLAGFGNGFTFDALRATTLTSEWGTVAFSLGLLGFGMKAGLIPVHVWLPEAHPVAPSHISALMSGVMLKMAVYGFVRFTFDLLGNVEWQWGLITLLVGSVSGLMGAIHALQQSDLKRLLAYSSVENVGIIFLGLGLSLIFLGIGHPRLAALGLIAALYHGWNHALFKSLLFLGAGAVISQSHQRDLNQMGGLIRRMPQTAGLFLVGSLAMAGLPPLNGFVSEWLTFQTALQVSHLESGILRTLIPVNAALLALTAAIGAAAVVKIYGVAFLGQPRSRQAKHAREADLGMRAALALLAAGCLFSGIFPNVLMNQLGGVSTLLLAQNLPQATAEGTLWLTPLSPQVSSYSAPLVVVGMLVTFSLMWTALRRTRGRVALRRSCPWECGFGPLSPRMQYTSQSFSMPIRRIFRPLWHIQEQVEETTVPNQPSFLTSIRHQLLVGDHLWTKLYEPLGHGVSVAARWVGYLQTGRIRNYLAYSFITLLLLLWVIT